MVGTNSSFRLLTNRAYRNCVITSPKTRRRSASDTTVHSRNEENDHAVLGQCLEGDKGNRRPVPRRQSAVRGGTAVTEPAVRGSCRAPPCPRSSLSAADTPMYELAPYVFACETGRNFMFLDLQRDRYLAVPRARLAGLHTQIRGWDLGHDISDRQDPRTAQPGLADELVAAGILRPCDPEIAVSQPPLSAPEQDSKVYTNFLLNPSPAPDHARVLASLLWADYALRNRTLFEIVTGITSLRTSKCRTAPRPPLALAERTVERFLLSRPWYPRNYLCLFDSLALLRYLALNRIAANLIFGVREDPFAAHCWLQYGTVVINDHLDRARVYSPIMSV